MFLSSGASRTFPKSTSRKRLAIVYSVCSVASALSSNLAGLISIIGHRLLAKASRRHGNTIPISRTNTKMAENKLAISYLNSAYGYNAKVGLEYIVDNTGADTFAEAFE